jgi:carboxylesterase
MRALVENLSPHATRRHRLDRNLIEGTEEFTFGDGPTSVLMIHGFTGSPQGLRGLGEYLGERGMAVTGVRLPGHGTTWQDLNAKSSADWVQTVEKGYATAAEGKDEVFIVALSFGAALAIDFIARHPDRITGLVTLAGFVRTGDPRRFLAPVIPLLTKSLPGVANDIADPEGHEIAYDRFPTVAGLSMLRFVRHARNQLPNVRCPILVMHGRNDHTVEPFNATTIYDSAGSSDKELIWCERSYHVITLDYDRAEVYKRTYEFIEKRSRRAV